MAELTLEIARKIVDVALAKGVEKKDQKAANEALTKIGKSCMTCHDQHK